jgi:hypothetical protein
MNKREARFYKYLKDEISRLELRKQKFNKYGTLRMVLRKFEEFGKEK